MLNNLHKNDIMLYMNFPDGKIRKEKVWTIAKSKSAN